ncbi:glycerophosphodiester phosphodiesterase [Anaerobacillus sp. MEB173]|uniref:glycerophosphodiester phosphodiesterase n=1 Tax=Anaerobacillus sp. MEB173 TaxID=3383345 RepID=UPI003F8FA963
MKNNGKSRFERKRRIQWWIFIVPFLALVWLIVHFFPIAERKAKPFFKKDRPLVIAHRGGAGLAPENTLAAFENAKKLGADAIEFDIHMTKDGHLVVIHDPTVDRTTNGTGRVEELTFKELRELDAGHNFKGEDGTYSFRNQGVNIPTVEEVFDQFSTMKMVIEIKDTNSSAFIPSIAQNLWTLIQEYDLSEQVIIGSFDQRIINTFVTISNGEVAVSSGRSEVASLVFSQKFYLNGLYAPSVDAFQIPAKVSILNLADTKLINAAKRRGMDIHYWTINEKTLMRELLDKGANGIITDYPNLLLEVLHEEKG